MEPFTNDIKKIIICLLSLPVLIVLSFPAFAQQASQQNTQNGNEKTQQEIESLKMAYLTNQLNLSPKEAQKFWPLYNQYEQELQQINKKERENQQARDNLKNPTDQQIEQSLDKDFQLRQQALQLHEKYRQQFRDAIPPRKVAKLYQSEREFNMKLIQELHKRQNTGANGGNVQQEMKQQQQMQQQERKAQQQQMHQEQRMEHQMQHHSRPPRIPHGRER